MNRTPRAALVGAMALSLAGTLAACGGGTEPGDSASPSTESTYAAGDLVLPERPEKIVSLSATATEMLWAIDAGDQVTAVDMTSNHPEGVPTTDLDAYMPNVEAITEYQPDLVVLSHDQEGIIAKLEEVEVPVYYAPAAATIEDTYRQISDLGALTGHTEEAETVNDDIATGIEKLLTELPDQPEPLTAYYELDNQLFSLTSTTFAGSLLEMAGLENIADAAEGAEEAGGYPQLSAEYILDADPDLIFVSGEEAAADVTGRDGWDTVTAVKNDGVVVLDPDVASRWGPRVVELMEAITTAAAAA
ncbi:iron complex transport system substrate-binding protein [Stackebrandtia albiflava]|uniref:Iron complex transport system substrate-binding protein n=1 Tax=Stackebrandtia albiflava TaxID=406432 RepID=A0A562V1I9_9ACTN|nr:ABC transporter substrate-binding protein [Stackebrandtia albiflava]TWJ11779.1 iron complex transport system substrate-binding protein [Stackebrandtia albiflava]